VKRNRKFWKCTSIRLLGLSMRLAKKYFRSPGKTGKIILILLLAFGYNQLTYSYKLPIANQLDDQKNQT
jgi:hypothetical protein